MLYKEISRVLGYFFLLFAIGLLAPTFVAFYYQWTSNPADHPQPHVTLDFFETFLLCLLLARVFLYFGRKAGGQLYIREGIVSVVLIWFITPAIAAIPFLTSGTLDNPLQAYFEMVSGFTTTGSTVLQAKAFDPSGVEIPIQKTIAGSVPTHYSFFGNVDPVRDPVRGVILKEGVEALGKGLLFWRSFTQWLGGVGIVVLFVAVLPALGVGGKVLFQSEVPGPSKEGITPRIKDTAENLWKIYLGMTLLQLIVTYVAVPDLPFFESLTITFSTLSTGGFSTQNESIAGYASPILEWVIILFMILGSINFSLYYFALQGKFYRLFDPEFILFLILVPLFSGLIIFSIHGFPEIFLTGKEAVYNWTDAIRQGLFHLVSAQSTTGFAVVNFDVWPYTAQVVLLVSMYVGGMSGSTSGGMKVLRQLMLFKIAQNKVESLFRPSHIKMLKIGTQFIDSSAAITVLCFFLIVVATSTLGTFLFVYDGVDMQTAIGLTACMLNNTGMSFGMANPLYSCAFLSDFGLIIASLEMLFGRLEYYAVLAFLVPAFWRQDS